MSSTIPGPLRVITERKEYCGTRFGSIIGWLVLECGHQASFAGSAAPKKRARCEVCRHLEAAERRAYDVPLPPKPLPEPSERHQLREIAQQIQQHADTSGRWGLGAQGDTWARTLRAIADRI